MKPRSRQVQINVRLAQTTWKDLSAAALTELEDLTKRHGLSVAMGDLRQIDGRWYVTHTGLLRIAHRRRCYAIRTSVLKNLSDPIANRWVFKATVYRGSHSGGFVGYGDADSANTSPLVRGAEMRVAETRAVNRALRRAFGIGLCSVEELGSQPPCIPPRRKEKSGDPPNGRGTANGQPRLRDRLCLLIREHKLNPSLVKRYAADFCGTESLRDAGRDLVEAFVSTIAEEAAKDRAALICKLNSYSQPEEVKS